MGEGFFYNHTNKDAEDFKIERCNDLVNQEWEVFVPAKKEVLIGGLIFLDDWILRSEISNALGKLYVKNKKTGIEEEIIFTDEKVIIPSVSLMQKDKNTDLVHLSYSSPKTPGRTYLYNLKSKEKNWSRNKKFHLDITQMIILLKD